MERIKMNKFFFTTIICPKYNVKFKKSLSEEFESEDSQRLTLLGYHWSEPESLS